MAEYIERESGCKCCFHYDACFYHITEETKRLTVNECPLFVNKADVVEVVRCKDCKHAYINSFSAQSGIAVCKFWSNRSKTEIIAVQHDDYCSYGAKMDGKGDGE